MAGEIQRAYSLIFIPCPECNKSEEIVIAHHDGVSKIYMCHNRRSVEFGRLHADYFGCELENKAEVEDY